MTRTQSDRLAVDGGEPVRRAPFPTNRDASGRRLGAEEKAALERVIESGALNSTVGPETRALEAEFAALMGAKHAVASSSGTSAIHLAIAAIDPEPGSEIITTPVSDGGTVLPILAQNAVPVFADVDPHTGNLDVEAVRRLITDRTVAIVAVHLFGIPAEVEALRRLCDERGLYLIEDCAQAYLTECGPSRSYAGRVGHLGCFSLQQSKHITAGDGGLLITDDDALARRARLFADKGWPRDTNERTHLFLALNYRMTELQAAVARAQLTKLASVVADRRSVAARLAETVAELPGVRCAPSVEASSHFLFPLFVDAAAAGCTGTRFAAELEAEGAPVIVGYLEHVLYDTPIFRDRRTYGSSGYPLPPVDDPAAQRYAPGLCPNAEALVGRDLTVIAVNENYTDADVDDICTALRKVSAAHR